MYKSAKFKFLNNNAYLHYIPKVYNAKDFLENNKVIESKLILRSALKEEGDKSSLKSGISLTEHGIQSQNELKIAIEKLQAQKDFDEIVLQEEVFYHTHLTIYIEGNFVFGEVTGSNEFFILSGVTQTGDKNLINSISSLVELIQKKEDSAVLIEVGLSAAAKVYLFQLMHINQHPIQDYIKNDLFKILIQKKDIYLRKGILNLIKTEYLAYKIRSNREKFNEIEQVFFNWISLLHYFRLYCMHEKVPAEARAWQSFLVAAIEKKGWVLKSAYEHIKISSQLRQTEEMPELPAGFKTEEKIYLGKGEFRGVIGEDIQIINDLKIDDILKLKSSTRVILSNYASVLSHPCLLLVERGIFFVGALSSDYLENIPNKSQCLINFERRKIEIL